jgi:hypothetical protein
MPSVLFLYIYIYIYIGIGARGIAANPGSEGEKERPRSGRDAGSRKTKRRGEMRSAE